MCRLLILAKHSLYGKRKEETVCKIFMDNMEHMVMNTIIMEGVVEGIQDIHITRSTHSILFIRSIHHIIAIHTIVHTAVIKENKVPIL